MSSLYLHILLTDDSGIQNAAFCGDSSLSLSLSFVLLPTPLTPRRVQFRYVSIHED